MSNYTTTSLPKRLVDNIKQLIEETGYWPSVGAFVREAALTKLHKERERRRAVNKEAEG